MGNAFACRVSRARTVAKRARRAPLESSASKSVAARKASLATQKRADVPGNVRPADEDTAALQSARPVALAKIAANAAIADRTGLAATRDQAPAHAKPDSVERNVTSDVPRALLVVVVFTSACVKMVTAMQKLANATVTPDSLGQVAARLVKKVDGERTAFPSVSVATENAIQRTAPAFARPDLQAKTARKHARWARLALTVASNAIAKAANRAIRSAGCVFAPPGQRVPIAISRVRRGRLASAARKSACAKMGRNAIRPVAPVHVGRDGTERFASDHVPTDSGARPARANAIAAIAGATAIT